MRLKLHHFCFTCLSFSLHHRTLSKNITTNIDFLPTRNSEPSRISRACFHPNTQPTLRKSTTSQFFQVILPSIAAVEKFPPILWTRRPCRSISNTNRLQLGGRGTKLTSTSYTIHPSITHPYYYLITGPFDYGQRRRLSSKGADTFRSCDGGSSEARTR